MKGFVAKKGEAWYIVLEIESENGTKKKKWISPRKELNLGKPSTKRQAQDLLVKLLRDMQQGVFVAPNDMTVKELLAQWMANDAKMNLRQTTFGTYETYIKNHIVPEIGNIRVPQLKPLHLQKLYTRKLESGRADGKDGGLSPNAVGVIHKILSRALSQAVTWEVVARNVAEAVSPPRITAQPKQTWTPAQAQVFLAHIAEHRLFALYFLAVSTGMRKGEVLGLRWQDIDWERQTISVVQSIVATSKGPIIAPTKTSAGKRMVAASLSLLRALKAHQAKLSSELLTLGVAKKLTEAKLRGELTTAEFEVKKRNLDLVFLSELGTPLNPNNILRQFKDVCKKIGVPVVPFHALRHTHATLLLQEGVHPKIVSERLGHSRVGVTLDVYSHVLPDMQTEAAAIFDRVLKNKTI